MPSSCVLALERPALAALRALLLRRTANWIRWTTGVRLRRSFFGSLGRTRIAKRAGEERRRSIEHAIEIVVGSEARQPRDDDLCDLASGLNDARCRCRRWGELWLV